MISARETLDSIAPLPSIPPESERASDPNLVLKFMHSLHASDRTVAAAIYGDLQEHGHQIEALKTEVDALTADLVEVEGRLAARLEHLEAGYKSIAQDQLYVRQEVAKTNRSLERFAETWQEIYNKFDARLGALEKQRVPTLEARVDKFEGRQQQQYAEVLRRLEQLETGINDLRTNGGPPTTPRQSNDSGGPSRSK